MQATEKDLSGLLELQEIDRAAITAEKKLEALPQRQQLQELAGKKQAVLDKLSQVTKMHDAAHRKVTQIEDEVAILNRKQDEVQGKIDESSGDFRAVQSLTRDLEGIAKRLSTLADEQQAAEQKYRQVLGVKTQVEEAIDAFDAQALRIRESFQLQAGQLKEAIDAAHVQREAVAAGIDAAVLKAYAEASRRGGGVGVARLVDTRCGTCRNVIDANRLLQVRREAPLATCPSCGRLLIVP